MTDSEARFILGLPPTYSARALKQAYRRAAATNHPDRGGKAERMVLVNEAYEVLSSEPAVVGPGPGGPAWAATDTEAFRPETGSTPPPAPEHPLERYVRGVAGVLAASGWIAGMIDSVAAADPSTLRVWTLLGLPFCYLLRAVAGSMPRANRHSRLQLWAEGTRPDWAARCGRDWMTTNATVSVKP